MYLAGKFPNAPVEKAGQTAEDSPLVHLGAAVVAGELVRRWREASADHRYRNGYGNEPNMG